MTPAVVPGAEAATCPSVSWGSLPEVDATFTANDIESVRSGRHACYDRLVIDLDRRGVGYDVRYGAVYTEGAGERVSLRGTDIRITVRAWGRELRNSRELVDVRGYDTFRQVAFAGTFEGQTTLGLGVRARLPMRVFELDGPGSGSRLVIDVAHHW
ncbi:hypothetical protein GC722_11975 [Auraticoccus sp. F435]|uniref:AMIN-like domain-containing protein n=1 Tax=Auraticoccus cholistanensis TaxID=2656650 RepID=A0A6A9UY38_9ACTN|nr:hypothetical protein [Auraticoccus cholistanensis]